MNATRCTRCRYGHPVIEGCPPDWRDIQPEGGWDWTTFVGLFLAGLVGIGVPFGVLWTALWLWAEHR